MKTPQFQYIHTKSDEHLPVNINAIAYAYAKREMEAIDSYVRVYIKKRPWFIPEFLYRFALNHLIVLTFFRKV